MLYDMEVNHPHHPAMTTTQEIATKLAAEGMSTEEMVQHIYGCSTYATLSEIIEAVNAAKIALT
jgi:hypothetical protein